MGLDFTLFKKRKDMSNREFFDQSLHDINSNMLAYGRKSWELVHALANCSDVNCGYGTLTYEAWNTLMKLMEPIGDKLERIEEAFDHESNAPNDYPEFIFTDEDKKYIAEYEYWYNKTFDECPYLDYDFSVGYMMSFWEAKDKVYEVLDDPEYEVLMDISY